VDGFGNVFMLDRGYGRIREVTAQGLIVTIAGSGSGGDGGPATAAPLWAPGGIAVSATGVLTSFDAATSTVRQLIPAAASTSGCVYSFDQSYRSFPAAGGYNYLEVAANGGACSWLTISYADWISVNQTAPATGTGLVILSVSSNPNPVSRTGTVWIAGSSVMVSQGAGEGVGPASASSSTAINVAAVQLIVNEALGISSPVDDLNQDGVVNLGDVQQVITALLGQS